jgi:hypothetical protein
MAQTYVEVLGNRAQKKTSGRKREEVIGNWRK